MKLKVNECLWSGFTDYKENKIKILDLKLNEKQILCDIYGGCSFIIEEINENNVKIKVFGYFFPDEYNYVNVENEYIINKKEELVLNPPVTDNGPTYTLTLID